MDGDIIKGSTKPERIRFKAIPLREDNHAVVDAIRTRLSYHLGRQLSLSDTVMEGQRLLDEKIKREYEGEK